MKKLVLAISLALWAFASCSPKNSQIVFDTAVQDSLLPNVEWCVITEPYVAFYESTNWESPTTKHCRKGDIFQVRGKRIVDDDVWYKLDSGWVNKSALAIYSNKYMAQTAASKL